VFRFVLSVGLPKPSDWLENDLLCVEWDVKPLHTHSVKSKAIE